MGHLGMTMWDKKYLDAHEIYFLMSLLEHKTIVPDLSLQAKGLIEVDPVFGYKLTDKGKFHVHKLMHLFIQDLDEM